MKGTAAAVAVAVLVPLGSGNASPDVGFYKPVLSIMSTSSALGAGGSRSIGFSATHRGEGHPDPDDPTARITVFAPPGYSARLAHPNATRIGTVNAKYEARSLGGKVLNVSGSVRVADPRAHLDDVCAPGRHDAVWMLALDLPSQALEIPVYVDALDSTPTAASYRLQLCLASPDVPVEMGGAPLQGRFFALSFAVKGVWRNPSRSGTYAWSGVFTPYDSTGPAPSREVEARSMELLPVNLSLRGERNRAQVVVSGALTVAGARFANARVRLLAGTTPRRLSAVRELRVNSNGSFKLVLRAPRRPTFYMASAESSALVPCLPPSRARAGCVSANAGFFDVSSRVIRI